MFAGLFGCRPVFGWASPSAPSRSICCCSLTVCRINPIASSSPSLIRREVRSNLCTSTVEGLGKLRTLAATEIICPAPTRTDSPRRPASESRTVPSSTMSLTVPAAQNRQLRRAETELFLQSPRPQGLPGLYSIMTVVPVMAAVTGALRMVAPPASLGTWSKIAPLSRSSARVPRSKLKTVFSPKRASVWSGKVSCARDSSPVRTSEPPPTVSPTLAGFGCAPCDMISTFLTTRVMVAWLRFPAAALAMAKPRSVI